MSGGLNPVCSLSALRSRCPCGRWRVISPKELDMHAGLKAGSGYRTGTLLLSSVQIPEAQSSAWHGTADEKCMIHLSEEPFPLPQSDDADRFPEKVINCLVNY